MPDILRERLQAPGPAGHGQEVPSARVDVYADAEQASAAALDVIRAASAPGARLLLPGWDTPRKMYAAARRHPGCLDGAEVLQLSEFCGLSDEARPGSIASQLFAELDGTGARLQPMPEGCDEQACQAWEDRIGEAPVALAVAGLAENGAVGFNEPSRHAAETRTRAVTLAWGTRRAALGRFRRSDLLPKVGITAGLGTILGAGHVLVLALGPGKARALAASLSGTADPYWPASLLAAAGAQFICDEPAAALLGRVAPSSPHLP